MMYSAWQPHGAAQRMASCLALRWSTGAQRPSTFLIVLLDQRDMSARIAYLASLQNAFVAS